MHGGWSDPEVVGTPAVVAMVGMDALPIRNDAPLDCVDGGTAWIADNGYRCETIDGMTVYYGSDLCDSDDSDSDDPYDIVSEEYVDQYNFDVPEGMDLIVFERGRGPSGSDMLDDEGTGLALVCQTTLCDPQGKLDTVDIDPLANVFNGTLSGTAAVGSPTVRSGGGLYDCETILDEDEDIRNLVEGSIGDSERNTWVDWCDSAFRIGFSTFPSDAGDPQPTVALSDELFSDEVLADTPVSAHEELPMLALQVFTDVGALVVPPVIDQPVRRIMDGLVCKDKRMDEVSVFSGPICDPPIHIGTWDMKLLHGDTEWVCLLYSAGAGSVDNGTVAIGVDGQRLDHWCGVVWEPGIVGQQGLSVCYDCLCLMALFRTVMSLVHDWAEWSVWTGTYLGIACTRGTSLGVLSAGRIGCGGSPVDCSDLMRVHSAVVRIGYIWRALCERSSTGSLVFSALLDCLDVYCAAEFASCRLFSGTDVSGLLDLDYPSGGLACIGLWRRKVRRWWRTGLVSRLVSSCTVHGTPRRLW